MAIATGRTLLALAAIGLASDPRTRFDREDERVEIRELRAFLTVVDEGGVSAAARRLHVSQSALSQTLRTLERRLGRELLVRDHSGARPTPAGAELLPGARELVQRHDLLLATMTGPALDGTHVRVGVPLELPEDVLPTLLTELALTSPTTSVELFHSSSSRQLESLRAGRLDLALVRDRPVDETLDAVLALEEPLGVVVATEFAAGTAGPQGIALHRLAALQWLGFPREESPAWHNQIVATFRSHGIAAREGSPEFRHSAISEVKVAGVVSGAQFALAPPAWRNALPEGVQWHPLVGDPLVRRTWGVWTATARSRGLAAVVAALDH